MSLFEACDVRWPMQAAFVSSAFHRWCCDERCGHWQQQMDLKALALHNDCRSIFKFHLIHFSFFSFFSSADVTWSLRVSLRPFHWSFQTALHSGCCFSFIPVKNTYCEAPLWKMYMRERTSWQMHLNASLKWPVDGKLSQPKWEKEWDIIFRTIIMMMDQREAGNINKVQLLSGSERSVNRGLNVSGLRFCHSSEGSFHLRLFGVSVFVSWMWLLSSVSRGAAADVCQVAVELSTSQFRCQGCEYELGLSACPSGAFWGHHGAAAAAALLLTRTSVSCWVNLLRTQQRSSLPLFSQQKEKVWLVVKGNCWCFISSLPHVSSSGYQ